MKIANRILAFTLTVAIMLASMSTTVFAGHPVVPGAADGDLIMAYPGFSSPPATPDYRVIGSIFLQVSGYIIPYYKAYFSDLTLYRDGVEIPAYLRTDDYGVILLDYLKDTAGNPVTGVSIRFDNPIDDVNGSTFTATFNFRGQLYQSATVSVMPEWGENEVFDNIDLSTFRKINSATDVIFGTGNGAGTEPPVTPPAEEPGKVSDWAKEEVTKAEAMGLVPDSLKDADLTQSINRAEFAAVAVKTYEALSGVTALPAIVNPFTDTNDIEILKAYNAGITTGTSATTFSLLISYAKNELPDVKLDGDIEDMSKPGTIVGYDNLICSYIIQQAAGENPVMACIYTYKDDNGKIQICFTLYRVEGGKVHYYALYNNVSLKYVTAQNDIVVVDGALCLAERNVFYDVGGTGEIAQETIKIRTIAERSEKFYLHVTDRGDYYEMECRKNGQTIIGENEAREIAWKYSGIFDNGLTIAARNGQSYMSAESIGDRLYLLDLSK